MSMLAAALLVATPAVAQDKKAEAVKVAAAADPVGSLKAQGKALADAYSAARKSSSKKQLTAALKAVRQIEADARDLRAQRDVNEEAMRALDELLAATAIVTPELERYIGETEKNLGKKLPLAIDSGLGRVLDSLLTVQGHYGG